MAFEPTPCASCGGGAGGGVDTENNLLCDTLADGTVVGSALAVYTYDENGNPTGPPTFIDPTTGDPYVAQGTLLPCPGETGCLDPVQFCFTTTSTGPVEHQGRMFDAVIPLNPGFALDSITVDAVTTPQNLVWDVSDSTGQAFADDLEAALALLFPGAEDITVTPPGSQDCAGASNPFVVHVGCLRLDQDPPDTLRFNYDGGEDLVRNPAYNETPQLSPPVSEGNYGFRLLAREDDPGPFPGNQPAERADCTNIANRGWETNDFSRTFEIWGQDVSSSQAVTPTPRGTPVQEVNSDGNTPEGGTTIWQTFQVTTGGNFTIRVVHGAREAGETHTIRLSTGDTDFSGPGDLIDNVTVPPQVTNNGGNSPGPWTVLNQVVALTPGTYTLSFKSTTPVVFNRGGLFTDMRAFLSVPGLFSDSIRTDNGCTVETEETSSTTTCEYWSPVCLDGTIESWQNAATRETLSNAAFWGQTPSPECCTGAAAGGEGGTIAPGNLVHNYEVCGVVGGVPTTLNRVVYTNQSGGVVASAFIGADGGPVSPSSWTPGRCVPRETDVETFILCRSRTDVESPPGSGDFPVVRTSFIRTNVYDRQTGALISTANRSMNGDDLDMTGWIVGNCDFTAGDTFFEQLCDFGNGGQPFFRRYQVDATGHVVAEGDNIDHDLSGEDYVVVGPVGICDGGCSNATSVLLCDAPESDTFTPGTAIEDSTSAAVGQPQFQNLPTPYLALWSGGVLNFPADPGPGQFHRAATGKIQAVGVEGCADSTGTLTVSVRVQNNGPDSGQVWSGALRLFRGTTLIADRPVPLSTPVGWQGTLSLTIPVTAADLTSGDLGIMLALETYHLGAKSWTADQFSAEFELTGCDSTNSVQFLRTVLTDCETGAVISTSDSTLDGDPYVVTGTVGECRAADTGQDCTSCETQTLCDVQADGSIVSFLRTACRLCDGTGNSVIDTELDGVTPYTQTGTVSACASLARDTELIELCDIQPDGTIVPFLRRMLFDGLGNVISSVMIDDEGGTYTPTGDVTTCSNKGSVGEFILCDTLGNGDVVSFVRKYIQDSNGNVVTLVDLTLDGDPYIIQGTVGTCQDDCCPILVADNLCATGGRTGIVAIRNPDATVIYLDPANNTTVPQAELVACSSGDNLVNTGIRHIVGVMNVNVKTIAPGLQSVTLTVLTGNVLVTVTDGTNVSVPAGVTLTWSVADTDDSSLAAATFVGSDGTADYVLHWTTKATSAG